MGMLVKFVQNAATYDIQKPSFTELLFVDTCLLDILFLRLFAGGHNGDSCSGSGGDRIYSLYWLHPFQKTAGIVLDFI